jgi:hypothetical protein
MESASLSLRYKIPTTVQIVEERFRNRWVEGGGDGAIFESESLGWYIQFTGSWEGIYLGKDKPPFVVGDAVNIIIEKAQDALPSKSSV